MTDTNDVCNGRYGTDCVMFWGAGSPPVLAASKVLELYIVETCIPAVPTTGGLRDLLMVGFHQVRCDRFRHRSKGTHTVQHFGPGQSDSMTAVAL